jgi:hypothetical protein
MTNKDILAKLNNLKNVNPDAAWLTSNRELLLTQISNSGAADLSSGRIILINFQSVLQAISRPAFALGVFVFVLVSVSLFSHELFNQTKPNNSLYIARVISERLKLNTTFNSVERDKLEVRFASSHAQEISAILADPEFNTEANKDQVAKLSNDFNKEVVTVKSRINRISRVNAVTPVTVPADEVIIADSAKEEAGIQLAEGRSAEETTITTPTIVEEAVTTVPETAATSAAEVAEVAEEVATSTAVTVEAPTEADKILDEAQQLFDQKDYGKALDKLKEVDEIIK